MVTTIDGLASGIDTTSIVEGLVQIHQQQIDRLNSRISEVTEKQTAFKTVEAAVLGLRGSLSSLSRVRDNVFDARTVTSSDESLVKAAATSGAPAGIHVLTVNSLARAHQISSQGFADADSEITQGTFGIQTGNGAVTQIQIDSTNNTLQALATSINSSGAEVSATIVNDGSSAGTPYRLLLTASNSGTSSAITISGSLAASTTDATRPAFQQSIIDLVELSGGYTGTGSVESNTGGTYTGSDADTYTFTVQQGGQAGTGGGDTVILAYEDGSGENSGTVEFSPADVDAATAITVAEGLTITLGAGSFVASETFTVDVSPPAHDVQPASDAVITIGSGPGAITVASETNQIDDVISGVTLDLISADVSKTVTLSVSEDVESARSSIDGFVTAFNSAMTAIDDNVRFDAETGVAGVLLGNRSVISIQDEIRNGIIGTVSGLTGSVNRLASIGISFDVTGKLSVNSGRLDDVLNGRDPDAKLDDVKKLFALNGDSDNGGVRFLAASTRTNSGLPIEVDITQSAERAVVTAASSLAATTVIDATNNILTLTLDGQESNDLLLAEGTYTRAELATHLENVINGAPELPGRKVSVSVTGDSLQVTSLSYGQASEVSTFSGTAASSLGFSGDESDNGRDVAGKFIVDGQEEEATGAGQLLIGVFSNEKTADLQVRVSLSSGQVQAGVDATLDLTRGLASSLDLTLNSILDSVDGRIKTVNDSFDTQVTDLEETIVRQAALVEQRKNSLIEQFVALESAISQFQNVGNFLAASLTNVSSLKE